MPRLVPRAGRNQCPQQAGGLGKPRPGASAKMVAEKVATQAPSQSKPAASINSIRRRGAPSLVIWMDTLPSLRRRNSKWPSRSIWALICCIVSNRRADGEPGTAGVMFVVSARGQLGNKRLKLFAGHS